jgi:hypothetical protein
MNPFEMVAFIVAVVMVGSVLRARYRHGAPAEASPQERAETLRLRDDVKALKQRVQVLEQIVTDRGAETASQIEALRQPRISQEDEA